MHTEEDYARLFLMERASLSDALVVHTGPAAANFSQFHRHTEVFLRKPYCLLYSQIRVALTAPRTAVSAD
jgi:hypothetical protein